MIRPHNQVGVGTTSVLEVPIAVASMSQVIDQVNEWAVTSTRPRLVTFTNVHMVVEAALRPDFKSVLKKMDLNCPDGSPIYWLARKQFGRRAEKIAGPEFMPLFCEQSAHLGHRHFIYGGAPGVAADAAKVLTAEYPGIQIAGHFCPPFRKLTPQETDDVAHLINASKADIVWVCLGCPKQELWMYDMHARLNAKVILAVGQAVDIIAGRTKRAPAFVTRYGGEWAYRLFKNPRRLWKRYLVTNLLFLLLVTRDGLKRKRPDIVRNSRWVRKVAADE